MINYYHRLNEIRTLLHVAAAPTIYNEEAFTNRELGIAMAQKMNEVIKAVNLLADTVESMIPLINTEEP